MATLKHFEVTLVRSGAGRSDKQRKTLAGLGLKRIGHKVYLADMQAIRGMLFKVVHLVAVQPRTGEKPLSNREKAAARRAQSKVNK